MQSIFPPIATAFQTVGIVGAGAMGRGIAQLASQAGSKVILLDMQPGAALAAIEALSQTWQKKNFFRG
jgi:3-hydroxybutyryl-CoA dehydrogenase